MATYACANRNNKKRCEIKDYKRLPSYTKMYQFQEGIFIQIIGGQTGTHKIPKKTGEIFYVIGGNS